MGPAQPQDPRVNADRRVKCPPGLRPSVVGDLGVIVKLFSDRAVVESCDPVRQGSFDRDYPFDCLEIDETPNAKAAYWQYCKNKQAQGEQEAADRAECKAECERHNQAIADEYGLTVEQIESAVKRYRYDDGW